MSNVRVVYAGNRSIGVQGLDLLRQAGIEPIALLLPDPADGAQNAEMKRRVDASTPVIEGRGFKQPAQVAQLAALAPDYILSVHFPYIFTNDVMTTAKIGTLNLHPAYLPYNRGWHTPSWAILEKTPIGATLHWVDEGIDSGDIALQQKVEIAPGDTAHSLYQRLLKAELQLLESAIPLLKVGKLPRHPQSSSGTVHRKTDLAAMQPLDLEKRARIGEVIDHLRGLTTSNLDEAAYFTVDGRRYRVRVDISEA